MNKKQSKSVYLDYAAATPMDSLVYKAMQPFLVNNFSNPSALYKSGKIAKLALDNSRKNVAKVINSKPTEIIFTAGGSESLNLAIFGLAKKYKPGFAHFITSTIEHSCVLNCFEELKRQGFKTSLIGVENTGVIKLDELKKEIKPNTVFISLMMANNEVGTIQPIAEVGKWLKNLNHERERKGLGKILFHTDACQAAGYLDLNVQSLGVDLMTLNGSKIYGPKQSGILYVKSGIKLSPIIFGGGQESGLRGGTENVAGIVGFAKALELVQNNKTTEVSRLSNLRDYLILKIKKEINNVLLNGVDSTKLKSNIGHNNLSKKIKINEFRLCNNINFVFEGVEGEALMFYLDAEGFEVSTASACSTSNLSEPSHVLMALGLSRAQALSSIRFTLGKYTQKADLDKLVKVLAKLINNLRKLN
jgi:cysteine desulfurase